MARYNLIRTKHPGIFRLADDNRLFIRATAVNSKTGKLRERSKLMPPNATLQDALEMLAALKREAAQHEPTPEADAELPTVQAYVRVWAQRQLSRGNWNSNGGTAETVGSRLDRYVAPEFGEYLVGRLTSRDLLKWLDSMSSKVGRRTVRATYQHLVSMDRAAREEYGLPPITYPAPPAEPTPDELTPLTWEAFDQEDESAYTQAQLSAFLGMARQLSPDGWFPICLLGFASGARVSELLAAQVKDFRLDGDVGLWLCRRHLVAATATSHPGIKWNRQGNKVFLDEASTRQLRTVVEGRPGNELMFPSDKPNQGLRSTKGLQEFMDRVCAKAGIPRRTTKVFRRTYHTLSHLNTLATAMAQAQAGHSDPKTTAIYIRPTNEHRTEHARTMTDVLKTDAIKDT